MTDKKKVSIAQAGCHEICKVITNLQLIQNIVVSQSRIKCTRIRPTYTSLNLIKA